ncbi:peptidoglycan recognition family protein [Streptomyces sp. WAC 04229]|uniref:peptidoglycan recognition protein family protein n=1 Tax=Streptomyces sp. WAC 04229 TaxID=2203206 RepID=UPI0021ADF7B8|nr:peptidoglycan recognition family protein [Streptomyces sp. WAC 04229]
MKLVTRAQLGWPASAAPSQTSTKGVKVHYEGAPVSTKLLSDHNACIAEWKAIRASHLANKTENYSDVAYNYAACPHGYLLEGRGLRKRTGANGNQTLNQGHYAIVGLVGSEGLTQPTDAMLSAIRDGIELLRANGAGNEIKGHRDGYATACPGGPLYAWVQKGAPRPSTSQSAPIQTEEESDMPRYLSLGMTKPFTLEPGVWKALAFDAEWADQDDDHYAGGQTFAHNAHYNGALYLQADGVARGNEVQARVVEDEDGGGPTVKHFPASELVGTSGDTLGWMPIVGVVGADHRAKIQVIHYGDDPITIKRAEIKAHIWPL